MNGSSEELSSTALRCLDGQLGEALDLAVSCRLLSDRARSGGDALTAVTLHQLASDLTDQAAILAPLVCVERPAPATPSSEAPSSDADTWLAALDARLGRAALVAQTDAMSPDLEATVAGLLAALAALYRTRRELLLVSTLLDAA
ncbi:MAG: hypothetical protein QOD57_2589 [Actinomycetota bacterium]|jgi:hypothetical protein|nr:hypothetical protein [Actinomycetota bacterium]MDQ1504862.1 hypothetical protein [Actinomycetota bacterium]